MRHLLPLLALLLLAASCAHKEKTATTAHMEKRAVYYWKTVLRFDSADLDFMRRHDIGRIYLRLFDVAVGDGYTADERTVPDATVRIPDMTAETIADSLGDMEFVPTVYITLEAIKAMNGREGMMARNIVTRARNMCSYNELPGVGELQLDCDWTAGTEESFFSLCDSARKCITELGLDWKLSSTIRLHQLARKAPPVDRGVLMLYNTGDFKDPDTRNSIIDARDIAPYMHRLASYPLHLDVAYPTYSWQLLYHNRQFAGLTQGIDLTDSTRFSRRGENSYAARRDIPYRNTIIREGDIVRQENSAFADIAAVKAMTESRLGGRPHSNILYHLDSENLSNYSHDEIEQILSTDR